MSQFERTEMLVGGDGLHRLRNAHVAVFGVGGVGSFVVEALARAGIGMLDIIDKDTVSESNINRQIIALHSTVGRMKVDVMKERILDINPAATVNAYGCFFMPETESLFDFSKYDYVVDAVDTVTAKIEIIRMSREAGVPVISCMGTGNKLDPSGFKIADISRTSVCPLARVMRRELARRGITGVKCVYSEEPPHRNSSPAGVVQPVGASADKSSASGGFAKAVPGSISFVPSAAGLIIAGEVIKTVMDYRK